MRILIYLVLLAHGFWVSAQPVIVIAHRGHHTLFPENSVAAFRSAIALGVDYIEVDLRQTKDSVLVVMHDDRLERTTGATGRVSEITAKALSTLRLKSSVALRDSIFHVPTFEEVLSLANGKIGIYLDFKDASVPLTLQCLRKIGFSGPLAVYINSEAQYHQWRKFAPEVRLIVSPPKNRSTLETFLTKNSAEIMDGNFDEYTPEVVALMRKSGRQIWVDVQRPNENEALWRRAIELRLDGLQTDHPEELLRYLRKSVLNR